MPGLAGLSRYPQLFSHWGKMVLGRSYWHTRQGPGPHYQPGVLAGYFNDMTAKVHWDGPQNAQGLPVVETQGRPLLFPTMLLQKALGHWDAALARSGEAERASHEREFLRLARWAAQAQDERGGWAWWPLLGLPYPSPYSAMIQGEGLSVLVRAAQLTGEGGYLAAAQRALQPLQTEVSRGGVARRIAEGVVLEEFPSEHLNAALNGWVFALFGLHEFLLVREDPEARALLGSTLRALAALLPRYDAGFWSYYDLQGKIASPFYHQLHLAQLGALALTFPEHASAFGHSRTVFEGYARSRLNTNRAMFLKLRQKLRTPPAAVLR
ncbi:hypothetical protein DEIPH_ctg026orf0024 [Deinococcus phoenicis]|uniref:D-glucuronyl C5-epimerase C-terminal domain-containing protein n=1 Tax=Deinococcus phoenicis TaxID=1476583 RepID=A0A016QQI7_9DEIO|nr:D-glucuronyl C5-epimerase family protein [Deinococcus phoenicis]EYB68127.1 hypothetical protein DEIPH_ctg026orf0024 [Deinococcus phoenicis]